MSISRILIDGVGIDLRNDTATAPRVKDGYTFHDKNGDIQTGSMPTNSGATFNPASVDQYFPIGGWSQDICLTGGVRINALTALRLSQIDPNFQAENIKSGVSILGRMGTYLGGELLPFFIRNLGHITCTKSGVVHDELTVSVPNKDDDANGYTAYIVSVMNQNLKPAIGYHVGSTTYIDIYRTIYDIGGHTSYDFSARSTVNAMRVTDSVKGAGTQYASATGFQMNGGFEVNSITRGATSTDITFWISTNSTLTGTIDGNYTMYMFGIPGFSNHTQIYDPTNPII